MEHPKEPAGPSLDRLKNLDSLPTISAQLDEAKRLCTHRARSDMICRWLIEKLKKEESTRTVPDVWIGLTAALRLLSPGRLGSLLSSFNLFEVLQLCLAESDRTETLLTALNNFLSFLLETSDGADAASVKGNLSLRAPEAAHFVAAWYNAVLGDDVHSSNEILEDKIHSFVKNGLRIWDLRKGTSDDSRVFTEISLGATSKMLLYTSLLRRKNEDSCGSKRTSEFLESSQLDLAVSLEKTLAKHVFLPARVLFFQKTPEVERELNSSPHRSSGDLVVKDVLKPIRVLLENNSDERNTKILACIPLLLDVALQCAPVITPKQRIHERPWIEGLWVEFYDIIQTSNNDTQSQQAVVTEMLSVISKRAFLSPIILRELVDRLGELKESELEEGNSEFLFEVVKVDSSTFADASAAEPIFSAITHSNFTIDWVPPEVPWEERKEPPLRNAWLNSIIIPTMEAFARAGDLPVFIDLWQSQLLIDRHNDERSVWTELDESFSYLLEGSLSDDQILRHFSRVQSTVLGTCAGTDESVSQSELNAAIVILNALILGVTSERLLEQIMDQVGQLITTFLTATEHQVSPTQENHFWALVTNCYKVWFPLWASEQNDKDVVAAFGATVLSSPLLSTALERATEEQVVKPQPSRHAPVPCDADHFVVFVCQLFHPYQQLIDLCSRKLDSFVEHVSLNRLHVMFSHPGLLEILSVTSLKTLFEKSFAASRKLSPEVTAIGMASLVKQAFTSAKLDDFAQTILDCMFRASQCGDIKGELRIIDALMSVPASAMSRTQREKILDSLVSLFDASSSYPHITLQRRYALAIKLFELPNPTCVLSTHVPTLHWLTTQLGDSGPGDFLGCFEAQLTTAQFSKKLVQVIVKQWLATQNQERSILTLVDMSQRVKDSMRTLSKAPFLSEDPPLLIWTCAVMKELDEGVHDALRKRLPHQDRGSLYQFFSRLFCGIRKQINELEGPEQGVNDDNDEDHEPLFPMLDAFLSLCNILKKQDLVIISQELLPIEGFLMYTLAIQESQNPREGKKYDLNTVCWTNMALAQVYVIFCTLDEPSVCTTALAERILKLRLEPAERALVLEAFRKCTTSLSIDARISLLARFIPEDSRYTRSSLLLLSICIQALDKEELREIDVDPLSVKLAVDALGARLFDHLLRCASETTDSFILQSSMNCIITILKEKPFLANQHSIEKTLVALPRLARNEHNPTTIYTTACQIISLLFLQHRTRLQGRYHIVVRVFQQLLSQLFTSNDAPRSQKLQTSRPLTVPHATAMARLLTLFCEPPQRRRADSGDLGLVDEFRKEQARVGQFVPVVLHQFCVQQLHGRLGDGMREALTPGLWAMIEAMEMHEREGVKVLSAAMNTNERAMLREVYDEWRRFGKWRGG